MTTGNANPPESKKQPNTIVHMGRTVKDDYAWLQNKDDPEVLAYLKAENSYAEAALKHTAGLQEKLYQEMRGRIKEDDESVPERRGDFYYHWRTEIGQQYRIFCRRNGSPDTPEQVLLDENRLAEDLEYCRVFQFEPSPDNRLLAYSVDMTGNWEYTLFVMDMETSEQIAGPIEQTGSLAWASDNCTLFYTVYDPSHRPYKVYRFDVRTSSDEAELVFHEPDDAYFVSVDRTRSGEYIIVTLSSQSSSEVHYLSAESPAGELRLIHPRQKWLEYYVTHHGDRFLIRTNDDENFKLMQVSVADPEKVNWQPVIAHRDNALLEEVLAFRDHIVVGERNDGLNQIRIFSPDNPDDTRYVTFPEPVYTYHFASNPQFHSEEVRFFYSSLVTPRATIDYNMGNDTWTEKKRDEIPSGYDPDLYASERLVATAPDGEHVPVSLVYRRGMKHDGSNPLVLYGYGSYGISVDPAFDAKRLSLIDRGFIFAIAHIRGGSEMGRRWYEAGRLMHKKNSFTDFIACAEHLIAEGHTSSRRLSIMGGSAGGLLVSAVTNMRPDLFKAVVAIVPFTNVIAAMLKPDLPLTVVEYDQWGDPNDPQAFEYMLSYSPYDNIRATAYPHIYVKAGLNDLQVPYWDPAKYVARLRATKTDENGLLLVTNMGAGHGGASGRFDYLREYAQIYAFLIDALDVNESA